MRDTEIQDNGLEPVYGPASPTDDDFIACILQNLSEGRDHWGQWRGEARTCYDFYSGIQWDEVDSQKLAEEGRPAVVFNRIVRTINSVAGIEIQNRQEVKYYPRNVGSNNTTQPSQEMQMPPEMMMMAQMQAQAQQPQTNDAGYSDQLNNASKWVREQNDAEDEESEAFQDALICGMGFTETRMDYETNPEGMILKDRIDPLEICVDPQSCKKNFADARWIARVKDYTRKQVAEMFPEYDGSGSGIFWNDLDGQPHDATLAPYYIEDQSDKINPPGMIAVVQYQYYVVEPYYMVLTREGQTVEIDSKKYSKAKAIIDAQAEKVLKMKKRVYKQLFLIGSQVFDHHDLGCNHFTLQGITGLRNRNKHTWFGLVHLMLDPQRWANKWLSQIQYIINTASKNAVLVETGAVKDRRNLEDNMAKPGAVIDLNPGGLQKIKEMDRAAYPDGIDRLLNYAIGAINDVPGVNLELIGMANRDQPIGLEQTRKQAGITVLATFFDSLRRYRKTDGRILAYFIREYLADGRLIRILGPQGMAYVPLLKSAVSFEYDVVVDDAPTSPNNKERTFLIMSQVAPLLMQSGIPIPPEILDYLPLPEDFIQKWKQTIAEENQPNPEAEQIKQIQMLLAQLEIAQSQADVEKTNSETVKNYATAKKDIGVGQEQAALAAQKGNINNTEQVFKALNMRADQSRKNTEMYLNHYRKMLEMQLENKLKQRDMGIYPSLNQIQ